MGRELRILILEDRQEDSNLIDLELRNGGLSFDALVVAAGEAFVRAMETFQPDLILAADGVPSFDGLTALAVSKKNCPAIPFILVSGIIEEDRAIEALNMGATDYVLKNRLSRLVPVVRRALREAEAQAARIKAAQALAESRESFRRIFDLAAVGVANVAPDGRWLRVNQKLCEILGYSREEMHQLRFRDITHPDDLDTTMDFAERLLTGEVCDYSWEKRYVRKDGGVIWANLTVSLSRDEAGRPEFFVSVIEDITERKRDQEALRESEEHYRSLFSNMLNGFAHCKMIFEEGRPQDFIYLSVNDAFEDLTGLKNVVGKRISEVIPSIRESNPELFEVCGRVALSGIPERLETYIKPLGIWFSFSVYSRAKEYFAAVFDAITERKRAEELISIRMSLLEFAASHPLEEVLQKTLDEIGILTDSPIGFYHFADEDEKSLSLQAWSTRTTTEFCKAEGKGLHYAVDEAGVWVDCVRERKPVIHNDYPALPHRKGLPEGHAPVIRELVVPIMRSDRIVAILGIGNKPADYNDRDVEVVSYLADVAWEITKRKRAEEALLESENRFKSFAENALVGIYLMQDGVFRYVNPKFAEMFGYTVEECLDDMPFQKLVYPDDMAKVEEQVRMRASGEVEFVHYSFRGLKKNGRSFHVEVYGAPNDYKGRPAGTGTMLDITEHKTAETAIQESEAKFRSYVENSPLAVFVADGEGRLLDFNPAAIDLLGYEAAELTRMHILDMHPESDRGAAARDFAILRKEGHVEAEHPMKKRDGSQIWVLLHVVMISNQFSLAYCRDITDRKKSEQRLLESEANYRRLSQEFNTVLDTIPDGLVLVRPNYDITWANRAIARRYDLPVSEVVGRKCFEVFRGAEAPCPVCGVRECIASGLSTTRELHGKHGSIIEVRCSPVQDEFGETINCIEMSRDITEHRRTEEQLRQAQKMEALGTLAGGVAHDFNNILGIIMGFTELAKWELGPESKVLAKLDEVLKATGRAKELVKQILAFSRRSEQQKMPLQLGLIVKEALKILRPSLPSTIEIQTEVLSKTTVLADPTQMHQVLMNLCTNAAHAMQDKGGVLEVRLTDVLLEGEAIPLQAGLKPGYYAAPTVNDTGCGIDPAILNLIFDPFFTTKKQGDGTGLGLSVVHGIVESHEGKIDVESELGKGTRFTVLIPALKGEYTAKDAEAHPAFPHGRERVLVVDDEPQLAEVVAQMLESLGYDVVSLTSGTEALELLRRQPPGKPFDLLITDMTMPHFTGADLAREVRGLEPEIPVILMTGFSKNMDEEKAKAIGIHGFLMKPMTLERLAKTVRSVLDRVK